MATNDARYFSHSDGSFFFPVGHNIHSPTDARFDRQFPWAERRAEGSAAYERLFPVMQEHGENITEVWMAAWSLGREFFPAADAP